MKGRMKLYIGLLALGIALIAGGLLARQYWVREIDILPDGDPIITMDITYVMRGEKHLVAIYEDGAVLYVEDSRLRIPSEEYPPLRTWKTGQLREEELDDIITLFRSDEFAALDADYQFRGGDMFGTFAIVKGDLRKSVYISGYISPDDDMTYPDMPYPLNEIYRRLKIIVEDSTEEVASEPINDSGGPEESGGDQTRTPLEIEGMLPPAEGQEAADDIVITPGGGAYRANVHHQGEENPWPSIESTRAVLGSGADSLRISYRDYIETGAGETRNNIIHVGKEGGLHGSNLALYAVAVPAGIELTDGGRGIGLPGATGAVLVIEISPDVAPGRYSFEIGLEIDGKDYGTVPCTVEVREGG